MGGAPTAPAPAGGAVPTISIGDFGHALRDAEFAEPDLCFIQVYDAHSARKDTLMGGGTFNLNHWRSQLSPTGPRTPNSAGRALFNPLQGLSEQSGAAAAVEDAMEFTAKKHLWLDYQLLRAGTVCISVTMSRRPGDSHATVTVVVEGADDLRNPSDESELGLGLRSYVMKAMWPTVLLICYLAVGIMLFTRVRCGLDKGEAVATSEAGDDGLHADGWHVEDISPSGHWCQTSWFLDALYFSIVTLTTVGYGDFFPETTGTRVIAIFFILFGTTLFTFALAELADSVAEATRLRRELTRIEGKMGPDSPELLARAGASAAPLQLLTAVVPSSRQGQQVLKDVSAIAGVIAIGAALFYLEAMTYEAPGAPGELAIVSNHGRELGVLDALYVAVVTSSTVGYGDFSPRSDWCKVAFLFYIPLSILAFANAMSHIFELPFQARAAANAKKMEKIYGHRLGYDEFKLLVNTGTDAPVCTRDEYILHMLLLTRKIDQTDIREAARAFDKLDVNGDKVLDITDVREFQDPMASPPAFCKDYALAQLRRNCDEDDFEREARFLEHAIDYDISKRYDDERNHVSYAAKRGSIGHADTAVHTSLNVYA